MSTGRSEKLLDKEIAVLKANSNLSEQQIRDQYKEFIQECPSGKMNKIKFSELYKKTTGFGDKNGDLVDHAFAAFDRNNDGSIDFTEFALVMGQKEKKDLNSTLDLAFEMLDTSGDGLISYAEVTKYMEAARRVAGDDDSSVAPEFAASLIFGMLSTDKGKKLNKQQFIDGCKNNPQLKRMFGN